MTSADVLMRYQDKLREMQAGVLNARLHTTGGAVVLIATLAFFITLGLYAARQEIAFWWPSLPIPVAAAAARRYGRLRRRAYQMSRLATFYEGAVGRIQGIWPGDGPNGQEFAGPDHPYAADLNVVGEQSLFELLGTVRTAIGRRGLAKYLLESAGPEEVLARQEAVRELSQRTELRERVPLLGKYTFLESNWETFENWLGSDRLSFPRILPVISRVTSALVVLIVLTGLIGLIPWIQVAVLLCVPVGFHSVVGLIFRKRVNRIDELLCTVSVETEVFRDGLRLLAEAEFQSSKLRCIAKTVRGAPAAVHRLERLVNLLRARHKDWFFIPCLLLMAGTQTCMALEEWRREHGESLREWLRAWAEFEALNALAGYAYEHPENSFPEFVEGEAVFEAQELGHPLLPPDHCVVNDVALNRGSRFLLVSGSNMSGKSTLLRAIGLNTVLALAGAPVRATQLRLSWLSVFASIGVTDSLGRGQSKFLAEVHRLRDLISAARLGRPVLFVVDEIFSGTNSKDRRAAAEAVMRTLLANDAIGALSTHDLSLCEIADIGGLHGVNVHMGSRPRGGPLDFDFRLRPGITCETNAIAIAQMAGVIA